MADRKSQVRPSRSQPLLVQNNLVSRAAAAALQSGVDVVGSAGDEAVARPKKKSDITIVTLGSEREFAALRTLIESFGQALHAPAAALTEPLPSTADVSAGPSKAARNLADLLDATLQQAQRETQLRLMTPAERQKPFLKCLSSSRRRLHAEYADPYAFCPGAETAREVLALMKEVVSISARSQHPLRDVPELDATQLRQRFEAAITQIFGKVPDGAKLEFIPEMLRLMETAQPAGSEELATSSKIYRSLYTSMFRLLGESDGQPDLEAYPSYEHDVRKSFFDTPCPTAALDLRRQAVDAYLNAWKDHFASEPVTMLTDPMPRMLSVKQALAMRKAAFSCLSIKVDKDFLNTLWDVYPLTRAEPDRSYALVLRSSAYLHSHQRLLATPRGTAELEKRFLEPFDDLPAAAQTPQVHDQNLAQRISLNDTFISFWRATRGAERFGSRMHRHRLLNVPPQSQPELRAQVFETRGWLIAQVMASDLTQPLVRFMQAPLPPGYPARSDALALINAVWRALALLIDTDQKRDLMASRLAYDLTFRTLAPDQRRLMRDNLLDGLFQYDKRAVGLPLVAKLAHLRQSGAALERRLDCCADLLCLGELGSVLDTETLTRAFDQMLAAYSEIDHAETRAHRIVDLARAVRAALTPPMFERLRDALLSIEGLRPASLADSKAERPMSLDQGLNGPGSPAQVFRRATQVTDLFAQLYEDGSDTVSTDLKRHSFFDRQLACIIEHARLTEDEKDFIALNLRSLRAHHGIAD